MPRFKVQVFQSYNVHRRIIVEVEGEDLYDAIDKQANSDAPSYDDPRWWESRSLENEEVTEPRGASDS